MREKRTDAPIKNEGDNGLRYRAGEDDSGHDDNAVIEYRFQRNRRYVIRVRVNYMTGDDNLTITVY